MKNKLIQLIAIVLVICLMLSLAACSEKPEAGAEVLQDVRVRQALSLAIDREYINDVVWNGSRISAYGLIPEGIPDTEPGTDFRLTGGNLIETDYKAAVDNAKSLLKEAGFPGGKNFPELELVYGTDSSNQKIAELIQSMWKEQLGVDIKLTSMEWGSFIAHMQSGDTQISSTTWVADYADPSTFFDIFDSNSGYNVSQFSNSEYDNLIRSAKTESDMAERARLYHEAEKILVDEMGFIPISFYADDMLIQQDFSGYEVAATGNKYFWSANKSEVSVCVGPQPQTLDPNLNATVDGMVYITHLFEGLYRPGKDGTFGLGQAKEVVREGNKYTVTLRDDILWSDGKPVTAYDFEYSWKRLLNPETAAPFSYVGADFFQNGAGVLYGEIAPEELSVSAVDEKTLVFETAAEFSYDSEMLAFPNLMPLRQDIVEANPESWSTDPSTLVTNGRYVVESIANEDTIVMKKNVNYWEENTTMAETINFKLMSDDNAILAAFKSGELDLADSFPSNELSALEETPEFQRFGNLGLYYLYLNTAAVSAEE
jgi:ABC-type oligopeptide transport system substrate-binding subunit